MGEMAVIAVANAIAALCRLAEKVVDGQSAEFKKATWDFLLEDIRWWRNAFPPLKLPGKEAGKEGVRDGSKP